MSVDHTQWLQHSAKPYCLKQHYVEIGLLCDLVPHFGMQNLCCTHKFQVCETKLFIVMMC